MLRTNVQMDTRGTALFTAYANSSDDTLDVTFNVRDFAVIVQFCRALGADVVLRMGAAGTPLLAEAAWAGAAGGGIAEHVAAELLLATIAESVQARRQFAAAILVFGSLLLRFERAMSAISVNHCALMGAASQELRHACAGRRRHSCDALQGSLPDPSTTAAAAAAARPSVGPRAASVAPIATPQTAGAPSHRVTSAAAAAAVPRAAAPAMTGVGGGVRPRSAETATQETPAMPGGTRMLPSQGPGTTAPDLCQPADLTTPATPPNLRASRPESGAAAQQPRAPSIVLPQVRAGQAEPSGAARPAAAQPVRPPAQGMPTIDEHAEAAMQVDDVALEQTFARHGSHAGPIMPAAGTTHSDGGGGAHIAAGAASARPPSAGRTQGAKQSVFSQHLVKLAQQLEQRERAAAHGAGAQHADAAPSIASPAGAAAAAVERVSMRPAEEEEEEGFWASQGDGEFGADDEECLATPADERPQTTLFPGM